MLVKPAAKKQCLSAPHLLQARTMGDIQPVHFDASAMLGISPPCAATAAQTKGDAAGLQHHRQLRFPRVPELLLQPCLLLVTIG